MSEIMPENGSCTSKERSSSGDRPGYPLLNQMPPSEGHVHVEDAPGGNSVDNDDKRDTSDNKVYDKSDGGNAMASGLSNSDNPAETRPHSPHDPYSDESNTSPQLKEYTVEPVHLGTELKSLSCIPSCITHEFPRLQSDKYHTVLSLPPEFQEAKDKWDANHVRMPHSKESEYLVTQDDFKDIQVRWPLIDSSLSREIKDISQLVKAILSYNARFSDKWDFSLLHELLVSGKVDDFFEDVLPGMVKLALSLPDLCKQPIPLLKKGKGHSVTLSQEQIACLLANAFFCTFPRRNSQKKHTEYYNFPDINFNRLFADDFRRRDTKKEKLLCLLQYFRRVTSEMPTGRVTFCRHVMKEKNHPQWYKDKRRLSKLHITSDGLIEREGEGFLQVDFANKFIGGGVLGSGCVQEEIRFVICPEMIVSRLITEALDDNECLIITGCEQFSDYEGYGDSFQWKGPFTDNTTCDAWKRICTEVVAIDAKTFHDKHSQFTEKNLHRELNKAYCGFARISRKTIAPVKHHSAAVATGNWGCGAFGGDHRLKAFIQLMAASAAGRDAAYFTFGNVQLAEDIYETYELLKKKGADKICDVYTFIHKYREHSHFYRQTNLCQFIQDELNWKKQGTSVDARPRNQQSKPNRTNASSDSWPWSWTWNTSPETQEEPRNISPETPDTQEEPMDTSSHGHPEVHQKHDTSSPNKFDLNYETHFPKLSDQTKDNPSDYNNKHANDDNGNLNEEPEKDEPSTIPVQDKPPMQESAV